MVRPQILAVCLPLISICSARFIPRQDATDLSDDDAVSAHTVNRTVSLSGTGTPHLKAVATPSPTEDENVSPASLITKPVTATLFAGDGSEAQTLVFEPGSIDISSTNTEESASSTTKSSKATAPPSSTQNQPSSTTNSADRWPQGTPTVICSNEEDFPNRKYKFKKEGFDFDRPKWALVKPLNDLVHDVAIAACNKADHIDGVPKDNLISNDDPKFNYRELILQSDLTVSVNIPNDTYKFTPDECNQLIKRAIDQCSGQDRNKFTAKISTTKDEFRVVIGAPGQDINNRATNVLPFTSILAGHWNPDHALLYGQKTDQLILNPGTNDDWEGYQAKVAHCVETTCWDDAWSVDWVDHNDFNPEKTSDAGVGPVYSILHVYANECGNDEALDGILKCVAGIEDLPSPGYFNSPNGKDWDDFLCGTVGNMDIAKKMFWPGLSC